MHVNTATNCRSRYTVAVGQVEFICNRPLEKHKRTMRDELIHFAEWGGVNWYWTDAEADR